jgi:type IV secretion system protein TrbL
VLATVSHPASFGFGNLAEDIANDIFNTLDSWVAKGDKVLLLGLWRALGATTQPLLTGSAFGADFGVMAALGATLCLPLLGLAVIQAVSQQDVSGLLRTALIRLPFAILFTAVAVQLVRLGLAATDEASTALLSASGGRPVALFTGLAGALGGPVTGFVAFAVAVAVCLVCFFVWFELVVRSAAVAIATLFLPLALAGLAWPATSHWARRLGETLAGLVLIKLVIAAVLALAVGALSGPFTNLSGIMEGVALLLLSALAPFAVFRLIPMVEHGATAHLEGLGRRGAGSVGAPVVAAGQGALGHLLGSRRGSSSSSTGFDSLGGASGGDDSGGGGSGGGGSGSGAGGGSSGGALVGLESLPPRNSGGPRSGRSAGEAAWRGASAGRTPGHAAGRSSLSKIPGFEEALEPAVLPQGADA